jgi:putative ABC transport system substrate-binding protein
MGAFRQQMRDLGYTDGQTVLFEGRRGPAPVLSDLAAELVTLKVEVIAAWSTPAVVAVKRRTTSIPIVMASSGDAVINGLVASLARPGGNVTGVSWQRSDLISKQVQLIRELVPEASRIGVLWDSTDPIAPSLRAGLESVRSITKLHFELVEAVTPADLDKAFQTMRNARVAGVLISSAQRYYNLPREVATAALAHRVVTVFSEPEGVKAGGLMAYTVDWVEMSRQAAHYVDRILRRVKPADFPVEQPRKFEFLINLKTAKAFGLTVPPSLLARADEVIE